MRTSICTDLQLTTVANMISVELHRRGIPVAEDEEERDNIISSCAEFIIYSGKITDIQECVNEIKNHISETLSNYPDFFITGEC